MITITKKTTAQIATINKAWPFAVPNCPACHQPMEIVEKQSDMVHGNKAKWQCSCGFVSEINNNC